MSDFKEWACTHCKNFWASGQSQFVDMSIRGHQIVCPPPAPKVKETKVKTSKYRDWSAYSLWERIEGKLEMLLKDGYEIISVSTTSSAIGAIEYYGVIFYREKP